MKREVYERQQGICTICGQHFEIGEMEANHITPWCEGGRTDVNNCQMLAAIATDAKANNDILTRSRL